MKKTVTTIIIVAVLIAAGSATYGLVSADHVKEPQLNEQNKIVEVDEVDVQDPSTVQTYPEKEILAEKGYADYSVNVVEDNPNKRIIVLQDENGKNRVKSIYIKKTNRLKVIEFDKGLIFNEVI
ncbi:hypothetical protein ACLIBH_10580 [Virgibacillus sp. W0430]|uniref:hypothetical protein n=1 Tax=Virgibacillus sp. W0430 TaxID=3391580 RepID=UPI003F4835FC